MQRKIICFSDSFDFFEIFSEKKHKTHIKVDFALKKYILAIAYEEQSDKVQKESQMNLTEGKFTVKPVDCMQFFVWYYFCWSFATDCTEIQMYLNVRKPSLCDSATKKMSTMHVLCGVSIHFTQNTPFKCCNVSLTFIFQTHQVAMSKKNVRKINC